MLEEIYYFFGFLIIGGAVILAAEIVMVGYPRYRMFKEANLKNPKYGFIPVVSDFKLLNLANTSMWIGAVLIGSAFVPFIGGIVMAVGVVYFKFKAYSSFDWHVGIVILIIIFPVATWLFILLKPRFKEQLDSQYVDYNIENNDGLYKDGLI